MKVVVQRVKEASVTNDTLNNQIKKGYCLLVGIGQDSTEQDADVIAKKIANARLFEDDNNKLNFNIQQMNGEILSVSQFTLYADVKSNRQVSQILKILIEAVKIYEYFNDALRAYGLTVKTGEFGTHMNVNINNDGPVTIIYESQDGKIQ